MERFIYGTQACQPKTNRRLAIWLKHKDSIQADSHYFHDVTAMSFSIEHKRKRTDSCNDSLIRTFSRLHPSQQYCFVIAQPWKESATAVTLVHDPRQGSLACEDRLIKAATDP
ncbi:hypothetical protein [Motiliproteus coralliicola]|uniref:hypothetical protein n=1 Tax=Motiliproteus coralliicola TaxID=2283196 RepID=UPI0010588637|nr:hypothetical protein [Motiliproteus coralliicola]